MSLRGQKDKINFLSFSHPKHVIRLWVVTVVSISREIYVHFSEVHLQLDSKLIISWFFNNVFIIDHYKTDI